MNYNGKIFSYSDNLKWYFNFSNERDIKKSKIIEIAKVKTLLIIQKESRQDIKAMIKYNSRFRSCNKGV